MLPFVAVAVGRGGRVARGEWAGYFVAELFRLLVIGSGLAWALAESRQVTTAVAALAVGAAAPLIVERLIRAIPLMDADLLQDTAFATANRQLATTSGSELNGLLTRVEKQCTCADEVEKAVSQGDQSDGVGE